MLQATQHISRFIGSFNMPRRSNDDAVLIELCARFQKQEAAVRAIFSQYEDSPPNELLHPVMDAWSASLDEITATAATTLEGIRVKAQALKLALDPIGADDCGDLTRSLLADVLRFG
jgi:hypothetical protein